MTLDKERYEVNTEEIAAKVLDGEAVLINLSTCSYYCSNELGGMLWPLIEGRQDRQNMLELMTRHWDVSAAEAATDLDAFLRFLLDEKIIRPTDAPPVEATAPEPIGAATSYEAPTMEVFRDMAQLLALDPPMPDVGDIPWRSEDD